MYTEHTRRFLPMLSLGKVQRMRNANTPCRARLRSGRGKLLYDRISYGASPPESSRQRIPRGLTFHILAQSPPGLNAGMLRTRCISLHVFLKCPPMPVGRRSLMLRHTRQLPNYPSAHSTITPHRRTFPTRMHGAGKT